MSSNARRFVVLHHVGHGPAHFDLMIDVHQTQLLKTWRLSSWPIDSTTVVEPIADHRRIYLEYEGDISGGRGRVSRVAAGVCEVVSEGDREMIVRIDGVERALPSRWI